MNRRNACVGLAFAAAAGSAGAQARPVAKHRRINPFEPSYDNAHEVSGFSRLLFVSGQVPLDEKNKVPEGFRAQAKQTWANVEAQLKAAGMTMADLVKVTIFLSDRQYTRENSEVRKELGLRLPAMTIVITGIYYEEWLLEIEAIAAA